MADGRNRIFGIDLGTTYSCIAYVNDAGKAEVVPNAEGDSTTPSVVYFEDSRNVVVGKTAKEELKTNPERVISLVKRRMGENTRFSGVADSPLTPQEVSAHILRKLVQDAQEYTRQKDPITDVVITCPAYFGVQAREATRQAGELAGLNVRYVIPEPTAAAVFYGMEEEKSGDQTVLVYDLGGGTFDVTVIDVGKKEIKVVCVDGDHNLGGSNWDDDVADWLAERFSKEHDVKVGDLMDSEETWQDLLALAEAAKKALTAKTKHPVRVTHGTNRSKFELTREEFDEITGARLNNTLNLMRNALETARAKGRNQIDRILLVGGSTYMPQVKERLEKDFPAIPNIGFLDPNQAVAKGAAVFGYKCFLDDEIMKKVAASSLDPSNVGEEARRSAEASVAAAHGLKLSSVQDLTRQEITNVTSKSFGVVVVDDNENKSVSNLILVNDKVPTEVSEGFRTAFADQPDVHICLMENVVPDKRAEVEDCAEIGEATIKFARALPKGSPIRARFILSADGLLSVHAEDQTTGGTIDIELKTDSILTADEVDRKKRQNRGIKVT